jgi:hypothetical protein
MEVWHQSITKYVRLIEGQDKKLAIYKMIKYLFGVLTYF